MLLPIGVCPFPLFIMGRHCFVFTVDSPKRTEELAK